MSRFIDQIKNFFYWGWKLKASFDWDSIFLIEMMELKIQRMYDYQINDGHVLTIESLDPLSDTYEEDLVECDKVMMRSMRICIKLCKRIRERSSCGYAVHARKKFDEKWGGLEIVETPWKNGLTRVIFNRVNVTDENEHIYKKESKELENLSSLIYNRDSRLLFSIMEKYYTSWWD